MPPKGSVSSLASDEAVLAGLMGSDSQAVELLLNRYHARVYGLALAVIRDPDGAEDVAQEAFVRAWRFAATYDPRRGTVATWLLGITRNLAVDFVRGRGRIVSVDPFFLLEETVDEQRSVPEDSAIQNDETRRVRTAINQLPVGQRRALILARWYGATAAEIATQEGIPLGTAKGRLRGAVGRLRLMLRDEQLGGSIDVNSVETAENEL